MILTGIAILGRDAELRVLPSGVYVCNLSLAFNYGKKGQDGIMPIQWIDAALFGIRSEKLAQYMLKGTQVSVVLDDPHIQSFTKSDGTVSSKLSATVLTLEFVGATKKEPKQQQSYDDDIPF